MSHKRYVYRHKPWMTPLSLYITSARNERRARINQASGFVGDWWKPTSALDLRRKAHENYQLHLARYGSRPYEKEGGGLTEDITAAKILGWRAGSSKKWNPNRGDLIELDLTQVIEKSQTCHS